MHRQCCACLLVFLMLSTPLPLGSIVHYFLGRSLHALLYMAVVMVVVCCGGENVICRMDGQCLFMLPRTDTWTAYVS